MGKRGPAKKPTAVKVLEGNLTNRPLPDDPEMPADDIRPFRGKAQEYWDHFAPICQNCGILTDGDTAAFTIMCELLAEHDATLDAIKRLGPDAGDDNQRERLVNRVVKLAPLCLRYMDRFGLTPSGRADLGTLKRPGKKSEFEKRLEEKSARRVK